LANLLINNCNADATLAANATENERVVDEATGSHRARRSTAAHRLEASIMFAEAMGEISPGDQPRRSTGGLPRHTVTMRQTMTSGNNASTSGSQAGTSGSNEGASGSNAGASGRSSSGTGRFFGFSFRRSNR